MNTNPYVTLGVTLDADDQTIRRAYLEAVRLAPPDHDPKRFQAVSTAYEQIKDESSRHRYTLFNREPPGDSPLDVFVRFLRLVPQTTPLPADAMKEFLRACAKT
ncbi:MAG: J domain-containing protein [Verrucomicrobiales bacterium]|nr:J domain-containing protein [Verrucomicrobiales bacterium]